ncbi:MAG: aminotransferase class V-fold PLP-dependent enzyme [Phycisphaerales bacterium]
MTSPEATAAPPLDLQAIRAEFPILSRTVHGKPLVYLDSAATKQKPACVIDAIAEHDRTSNANVHRALHALSESSTRAFEAARGTVRRFLQAADERECIFTSGVTDSINLVARAWAEHELKPGDRILLTHMEHHSNIVPWQMAAERTGAKIVVAPVADDGTIDMDAYAELCREPVRIASMVYVSNALGTINPAHEMIRLARAAGAITVVDAAQAAASVPLNVLDLGCDFLGFTSHKVYGPTGVGVLWGRGELLESMQPYRGGGDMIKSVSFDGTTYAGIPSRFEAGTPNITGAIGLARALEWLMAINPASIREHERDLAAYGQGRLAEIDGLRPIGTAADKGPVFSFVLDWGHAYDVGSVLDRMGVAVRTGHHCTEPLMKRFGVSATTRASCAIYSTRAEIDALVDGLQRARELLA